jgi:hypothetical protein
MRGFLIAILVLGVVVLGGGLIAATAYQAGLSTAVTVVPPTAEGAGTVVVPVTGYGWGWPGWGPGFGFFGFLGFLLFVFLLIGLIRAIAGPRRGWGGPGGGGEPGGWGGPGGPGASGHTHPWEARAKDRFDEWHRESHRTDPPATGA